MISQELTEEIWKEVKVRGLSEISSEMIDELAGFHELMRAENETQNLTRLISPRDFLDGHLVDCLELKKLNWIESELVADLGSGCGVPGIPMSILCPSSSWFLVESELRKAMFLKAAAQSLGRGDKIRVFAERFESIGDSAFRPKIVVSRAVGPVLRIFRWIKQCSTWNTLILFKGPNWDIEWNDFQKSSERNRLTVVSENLYTVTTAQKSRKLVRLKRT